MDDDLNTSLRRAVARLSAQWATTRDDWRDSLAGRFEGEYWDPISDGNDDIIRTLKVLTEEIRVIELALYDLRSL